MRLYSSLNVVTYFLEHIINFIQNRSLLLILFSNFDDKIVVILIKSIQSTLTFLKQSLKPL
jgi:hypothetical protein